ncbi:transient receptor potential protein-like [Rhagoletis pomonella]|uniref:transient receptor potential protein-like n=1 Tax=Rhagoletis pomonella TaxID=28610 RepID=UPI0017856C6D|nr:transient receptor potential protein-like [Rhagoletis pomonella]
MFGSYSVINIIVLLNMLIAMMSNSYQIISERADVEWKFARSQLWMSYFEDGGTVPPPFNIMPSVKLLRKTLGKEAPKRTKSFMRKTKERAQSLHDKVMKLLIRRFVTAEQRKRDDYGITEDDIIEVRQDISSLRFELLDIFQTNRFNVPDIEKKTAAAAAGTKKGKVMERRILKDFQIGFVENLQHEMTVGDEGSKDIFSSLARVIGKKKSLKSGDKDWNAIARQNTMTADPIGSKRSSIQRHSQRSLRRRIIDQANEGLKMNQNQLIEYNPNLGEVTRATRVAYVKFMKKKMAADEEGAASAPADAESVTSTTLKDEKAAGSKKVKSDEQKAASDEKADAVSKTSTSKDGKPGDGKPAAPAPPGKPAAGAKPTDAVKKDDAGKPAAGAAPKPAPTAAKPDATTKKDEAAKPAGAPAAGAAKPGDAAAAKPAVAKPGESTKPEAATKKEDAGKTEAAKPGAAAGAGATAAAAKGAAPAAPAGAKPDAPAAGGAKPADAGPATTKAAGDAAGGSGAGAAGGAGATAKTDDKKADEKKGDEKKPDDKKPDDKKAAAPAAAKPVIKVGQSSAAAGGERGKSTVTGRMISGWL